MNTGCSTKKVVGGKLLRMKVSYDAKNLLSVQLTGDFFLHPEEKIAALEESLIQLPVDGSIPLFSGRIYQAVATHTIELLGISPEDIAETLFEALHCDPPRT